MTAILLRAPVGFPGAITRSDSLTVQQEIVNASAPPTNYGKPVNLVSGQVNVVAGNLTGFEGWLVRPYPTQNNSVSPGFGASTPPTSGLVDVMRRGYMATTLARGTAVKGAPVYIRTTAGTHTLGDIEDNTDAGNVTLVPNTQFMGAADAGGIVEIAYNI